MLSFFFHRTYEIHLNGGTPFDIGVDLDPSVSLKGKVSDRQALQVQLKYIFKSLITALYVLALSELNRHTDTEKNPFN